MKLNDSLKDHLVNFSPFKLHGKENLIRVGQDSLYFTKRKNNNTGIALVYITPHHIFVHDNGDITADTLLRIPKENIIPRPKIRLRGYDGRSIELFETGYEPAFLGNDDDDFFHKFVENIHAVFTDTYYIPYLVHPFRLLRRNNELYILSHTMHYLFAPYNEEIQIKDPHFSHPLVFEKVTTTTEEEEEEYLLELTRYLILNFFHSLTITFLWFLNGRQGNLLNIRREMGFIRNDDKRWYNSEKINKNKRVAAEAEEERLKPCRNKRGICQGLALYGNFCSRVEEIHTYVCCHLLTVLPQTLRGACKNMRERGDRQILVQAVDKEFIIFNTFYSKIKNE